MLVDQVAVVAVCDRPLLRQVLGTETGDQIIDCRRCPFFFEGAARVAALVDLTTQRLGPLARRRNRPRREAPDRDAPLAAGALDPVIEDESLRAAGRDAEGEARHVAVENNGVTLRRRH